VSVRGYMISVRGQLFPWLRQGKGELIKRSPRKVFGETVIMGKGGKCMDRWGQIEEGDEIHVPADAVCPRRKLGWETGLRWMEKKGAIISTTEIIAFQLLKEAGTDRFKRLSKGFK